jgi:hypothetical protein
MREMRNAYKILVGKPEGKRPLGGPTCRWEDDFKMALREYGGKVQAGFIWLRILTSGRFL